jgi:hypothetical protein
MTWKRGPNIFTEWDPKQRKEREKAKKEEIKEGGNKKRRKREGGKKNKYEIIPVHYVR